MFHHPDINTLTLPLSLFFQVQGGANSSPLFENFLFCALCCWVLDSGAVQVCGGELDPCKAAHIGGGQCGSRQDSYHWDGSQYPSRGSQFLHNELLGPNLIQQLPGEECVHQLATALNSNNNSNTLLVKVAWDSHSSTQNARVCVFNIGYNFGFLSSEIKCIFFQKTL